MTTAKDVIMGMESLYDARQREGLMRFFKTGEGEYGEGDRFLGIKVPRIREIVRSVADDISLDEVPELLMSEWHEIRMCGFLILVKQFERYSKKQLETDDAAMERRDEILKVYLLHAAQANNWDLVDLSAPRILGHWLLLPTRYGDKHVVLDELAASNCLWKQRMSMVCTWWTSHEGDPSWCIRYAEKHLHHPHDLMQKATGWMLREMGKQVSMDLLRDFLQQHVRDMSRTTLRYAIEKMPSDERQYWMNI